MAGGQSDLKRCSAREKNMLALWQFYPMKNFTTSFCNTHFINESSILSPGVHSGAVG
jgi:hypothetical protein